MSTKYYEVSPTIILLKDRSSPNAIGKSAHFLYKKLGQSWSDRGWRRRTARILAAVVGFELAGREIEDIVAYLHSLAGR
jgi:hypothetical protein